MSDLASEFILIKEDLVAASQFLVEHLDDFENYNKVTFRNQLLTIQSKLSTLISISREPSRNVSIFKKMAEKMLEISMDIEKSESIEKRVYNIGKLSGFASIYLNEINSIVLKIG